MIEREPQNENPTCNYCGNLAVWRIVLNNGDERLACNDDANNLDGQELIDEMWLGDWVKVSKSKLEPSK